MSRRLRRAAAALLALCLAWLVLPASFAGAQDEDDGPGPAGDAPTILRAVDTTDAELGVLELMHDGRPEGLTFTQQGTEVAIENIAALAERRATNTVFVVDTGSVMAEDGGLQAVKDGLAAAVSRFGEDDEVGVVAAGDRATILSGLTSSRTRIDNAITDLRASPDGGASVWTGIRAAATMLFSERSGQPNVVVLTSGADTTDGGQFNAAVGQLSTAGAAVFVQGFGADAPVGDFERLAAAVGGSVSATGGADAYLDGLNEIVGWLVESQWAVSFVPTVTTAGELVESDVTIGDFSQSIAYVVGRVDEGSHSLVPLEAGEVEGIASLPVFGGSTGRLLMVVLVLAAVSGTVYALASIFGPSESRLSSVLMPYSEGPVGGDEDDSSLAKTALLKRAVAITEDVAERQGYLSRTEAALERADLPLRAAEALFFYVALVVIVSVVGLLLLTPMGALVVALFAALIPPAFVSFKAGRRKKEFQAQLPDMLQLLAGTLRAGYSLMQGVEAVSQEVAEPMGKELRRVVTESRLGRPLEESLDGVAERMASADFAWAVMAIRIQREVGGNLSELLMTVADTMIARERLRRDIDALTAEGRISALVLGILPIGLGVVMFMINPTYMSRLFNTTFGNVLLGLSIISMAIGFTWMRQIIKIDI